MISLLLSFAIATVLAIVLHGSTRRFVRNRLRYVDAVQKSIAPWAAGGAAGARDIRQGTAPVVYGP
jgi:hypothetical protein